MTSAAQLETTFAGAERAERQCRTGRRNVGPGRCHDQDHDSAGRTRQLGLPAAPGEAGERGERGRRSAPEFAPPAGECSGDAAAVNAPVVPVASHAVAQDRGAKHAGAPLPRPELNGSASPFPAPSCDPVPVAVAGPAAPSSDDGLAPQLLPPTDLPASASASASAPVPVPVPVVAPSESLHTASLAPESFRDDPFAELSPGPSSAAPLLHPQRQRELIEQATGMSTRQVAGLLAAAAPAAPARRGGGETPAPQRDTPATERQNPIAMLANAAPPSQSAPAALADDARAGGAPSAAPAAAAASQSAPAALSDGARAGGVPSGAPAAAVPATAAPQFAGGASADSTDADAGAGVPVSPVATSAPKPACGLFLDGGPSGAAAGAAGHTTRDSVHGTHQYTNPRHGATFRRLSGAMSGYATEDAAVIGIRSPGAAAPRPICCRSTTCCRSPRGVARSRPTWFSAALLITACATATGRLRRRSPRCSAFSTLLPRRSTALTDGSQVARRADPGRSLSMRSCKAWRACHRAVGHPYCGQLAALQRRRHGEIARHLGASELSVR